MSHLFSKFKVAVATTPTAAAVAPKTASSDRMSSMLGAARAGSTRRCRRPARTEGDGSSAAATPSRTHAQTGLRMGRTRQWASVRNTQDDDASLFLSLELGPRPMKVLARKNLHAL